MATPTTKERNNYEGREGGKEGGREGGREGRRKTVCAYESVVYFFFLCHENAGNEMSEPLK